MDVLWNLKSIRIGWRDWFYFHGFCTELWLSFENEIEVCVCVCICMCALFLWSLKSYIECCIGVLIYIHSIQLKRSHHFFFFGSILHRWNLWKWCFVLSVKCWYIEMSRWTLSWALKSSSAVQVLENGLLKILHHCRVSGQNSVQPSFIQRGGNVSLFAILWHLKY